MIIEFNNIAIITVSREKNLSPLLIVDRIFRFKAVKSQKIIYNNTIMKIKLS